MQARMPPVSSPATSACQVDEPTDIFERGSLAHRTVQLLADEFAEDEDVTIRTSKSQVAFRRRRGFAFVWRPGQWNVAGPEAVLSIATPWQIDSNRFRDVVHPAPNTWMHHLGLTTLDDVDAEVLTWLQSAAEAAG